MRSPTKDLLRHPGTPCPPAAARTEPLGTPGKDAARRRQPPAACPAQPARSGAPAPSHPQHRCALVLRDTAARSCGRGPAHTHALVQAPSPRTRVQVCARHTPAHTCANPRTLLHCAPGAEHRAGQSSAPRTRLHCGAAARAGKWDCTWVALWNCFLSPATDMVRAARCSRAAGRCGGFCRRKDGSCRLPARSRCPHPLARRRLSDGGGARAP